MVPRCSQSVPARLNQRACSCWHITDWRLWHDGTSDERPNEGWKLSASLFIKKEVGLRIIWNGLGWVELLQKLWREQLAALNRHWIIWSGVTARSIRVLRQFAASTLLKNEDCLLDPTIPPGWREFLRRLQACQLEVFTRIWYIWSGVTARYIRVRRQVAAENTHMRVCSQAG